MALENYVKLQPGVEMVLMLSNPRIEERVIIDPVTKREKTVKAWVADVTEQNHIPVSKTYSTLSEKHAAQLQQLFDTGVLPGRRTGITKYPRGLATQFTIRTL